MTVNQQKMVRLDLKYPSTYSTWRGMRRRCLRTNRKDYQRYGARGLGVCKRWERFEAFLEDMGEKPLGMSLDRIDNSKGYSKENCRWATPATQSQNRRTTKLDWNSVGEIRTRYSQGVSLMSLAKSYGVTYAAVWDVVNNRSWILEISPSAPQPLQADDGGKAGT